MARILLGAATLQPGGGIAQVARSSALFLRDAGHEVKTISFLDQSSDAGDIAAGGSRLRFVSAIQRHAISADLCLYDSAGLARAHPTWLSRQSVIWMHGTEVWEGLKPSALSALKRAKRTLVVSRNTLARFEALHGSLPHAHICALGTQTDALPPSAAVLRDAPIALIVGRIDATENYKGHHALIDAWPQVIAAIPDAQLVIAGSGSGLNALRAYAQSSPASRSIDLRGFVDESELDTLWRRASLFAMPSRGEGFGLVYIEAMRHGLPVIASKHDGAREVNIDQQTGFNVDLDTPGQLVQRLIDLLSNPDLRHRMGHAAQAHWAKNFRSSCFRARFLPLIEDLLPANG